MLPLLSSAQMRLCDDYTIQKKGIPSRTLMERAARAAIEVLFSEPSLSPTVQTHIIVLCGSGNNGGDGFAMARFLFEGGYHVTVCYGGAWQNDQPDGDRMSEECARQYALWQECGGKTVSDLLALRPGCTLVIDALFGIGLSRPPEGKLAAWIETVNQSVRTDDTPVLALDIPSGAHADTGKVLGCAVRATVTATMACPKTGLLLYPAAEYIGKLHVCDIGITADPLTHLNTWLITPEDLTPVSCRPAYANKGTFGRVLVIGGAPGMSGAVYFAAKSAYRAGAGLVELLTDGANRIPLQTLLPEAVLTAIDHDHLPSWQPLDDALTRADSVVIGCGLGQGGAARTLLERVLRVCDKPLVVDADALNLLAAHKQLQALVSARKAPTVLTPHLGEAARLLKTTVSALTDDLLTAADALAEKYNAVCVLKDTRTVVSDSQARYIQAHGNSGMATGGSGDCLAGVLGSLLAQHRNSSLSPAHLAALGVLLHAMAGDHAAAGLGKHALMASDIADAVGAVLHEME